MRCSGNRSRLLGCQRISLSFLVMLLAASPSWAGAAVDDSLLSPQSLCANSGNDGRDELQSMLDRVHKLKGYTYESVLTTYLGERKIVETGKLYFKSPNLVRFEVIKSASHSGAVVVKQPDGKIRGHMGGVFSGIKVTLAPDSKLLKSANGFSVMQSDLDSLLSGVAKKARGDLKCLALGPGSGRPAVVELLESDGDVEDRIAVDSRAKLPSEWNIFNSNKLFSALQLNNIQERNDLSDDMFTLSVESASKDLDSVFLSPNSGLGALQVSPDRPIDAATCKDINHVITRIAILSDQVPSEVAQGDGWIGGTREMLLSTCADLEVLQYELRPVRSAIEKAKANAGVASGAGGVGGASGAGAGAGRASGAGGANVAGVASGAGGALRSLASDADAISAQWNTSADSFHAALDQLLDQLSNDRPDSAVVKKAASALKSSVKALRDAGERIQDLM